MFVPSGVHHVQGVSDQVDNIPMHPLSGSPVAGSPSIAHPIDEDEAVGNEPLQDEEAVNKHQKEQIRKLGMSFFLFGLINNVLFVIILSAALDLVPPSTPKGIIAFCDIAPALAAKIGWPYILKGRVRYSKRLIGCCLFSISGMIVRCLSPCRI
jgi:battenin